MTPNGGMIMKIRFRRALSLVCTISLLLTCMPFNVLSEEVVVASDIAPDQYDAYPFLVDEEEFAEFEDEEPAASAEETPEELSVPAEETPEELPAPVEEAPVEPAAQQEGPAQQPAPAQKASAETVESETETQKNSDVETAVAEQETTEEPSEEQPAETSEETAAESAENTPAEADITITDEAWADDVIIVPENAEEADLSVSAELEEGKEYVVRVASDAEANLCFLLTSDAALEAAFTTEEHENLREFAIDVTENPNDSEETGTAGIRYTLTGIRFEQGSSGLIRIVAAAPAAFTLQVLTSARWLLENGGQAVEEAEEIVVEKQDEATAENQETGSVAEEAAAPEEEIPAEIPAFEIEEDTLVRYNGTDEDVTVPDGIREIGPQAFLGNETIKTVTLPDSVELINNAAFADCVNLEQMIRSEQSLLVTIGNGAFRNDAKLDISFAENVPNVLSNAFEDAGITEEEAEETEEEPGQESEEDPGLVYEGEDFTVTVRFGEEAGIPEGTELTVREILPETEEYEAYFNLTDEERAAIWNAVAEQGRLFLIAFLCNEEEIAPLAPVEIEVRFNTDEVEEEPEETEEEPEIVYAESPMVYEDEDFTVTVNFGDDAGFLQGTELRVREILPGTAEYALYSGQIEDVLNENWDTTAEFARFFDITFIQKEKVEAEGSEEGTDEQYIEKEIEPQAPIDVQMTFADVIPVATEAEEELQVQAIHFDEEQGAQVIESEARSVEEVAVSDETVVDTVAFSSDSFSVYGFVQTAKITESVISADGHTYKIEVTYGQDSEIPVNAELAVEEILPGTAQYDTLLQQALKAAKEAKAEEAGETEAVEETTEENETITVADDQYARFFDIEIQVDGEKKEPSANVSVSISLADAPEVAADELAVIHFAEEGIQVLETKNEEDSEGILFETDSFSMYGVIVVPGDPTVEDLDGLSFTIGQEGLSNSSVIQYMTSTVNLNFFNKSTNANEAAVWYFESAGGNGKYYIYTYDALGEKQYLRLYSHGDNASYAGIDTIPQDFTVTKYGEGENARFTIRSNIRNHYLQEASTSSGFYGYIKQDHNKLILTFTQPKIESDKQYVLLAKYEGQYYVILNDGTLVRVDSPNLETNTINIDDPMVWRYQNDTLYHHAKETGFSGLNLASDYFYRYLDPNDASGYTEENYDTTTGDYTGDATGYGINTRPLMAAMKLNYEGHKISSQSNPGNYIGIVRSGSGLKIVGQKTEAEAAEIFFVELANMPEVAAQQRDMNHMVNHIDISIEGRAAVSIPLAFGTYYYKDNSGNVRTLVVDKDNPMTIDVDQEIDVTREDVKRANIEAYTIDGEGKHVTVPDAFYISGYSGNASTNLSSNQTRIEGLFKVADLPAVTSESDKEWYEEDGRQHPKKEIREDRLNHIIYYTVTTTKNIDVVFKYNNFALYASEAEARTNDESAALSGSATVKLSATFNYWDSRNECPPVRGMGYFNWDYWRHGGIPWADRGEAGSGMDFELGTVEKDQYGVLAIEITKYIVDKAGNAITPKESIDNVFQVWYSSSASMSEVQGMDVDTYSGGQDRYNYSSNGYVHLHDKTVTVGDGGVGVVYDYEFKDSGMVYIVEDSSEKNLPRTLDDANGRTWQYVGTRLETEYVWRDDGVEYRRHVSKTYPSEEEAYLSLPDQMGQYNDVNGIARYNGFLEFYVYNIYDAEPIDVTVRKNWKHQDGTDAEAPEDARIIVTLGRYKLVEDPDHPVNGQLQITHTVTKPNVDGSSYYASYTVKHGERVVRSGSYDPSKNPLIMKDLPAGTYTLELSESMSGYAYDESTTINGSAITSKEIVITAGEKTDITIITKLKEMTTQQLSTVHVMNYRFDSNGDTSYQNKTYSFPKGKTIILTVYRPDDSYFSSGFELTCNGSTFNCGVSNWNYIDQNIEIVLEQDEYEYVFRHNWGNEAFWIKGATLKNESTSSTQQAASNEGEGQNGGTRGVLSAPAQTSTPTRGSVAVSGDKPVSDIPGMMYEEDSAWPTAEDGSINVITLSNRLWEDTVKDLDSVDDHGHKYLYYIKSVNEFNVSPNTQVEIITDSDGNVLTSNGETVLQVTNTVPNEQPKINLFKTDENGVPLPGATFKFEKTTGTDQFNTNITIDAVDGKYTTGQLTEGSYTISEITAPNGYRVFDGSINFSVIGTSIVFSEDNHLPDVVTYNETTCTFTIKNMPVSDGSLRIMKRWLDIYGNAATAPADTTITLKLMQMVRSQAQAPQRSVVVEFLYQGDGSGHEHYPSDYGTKFTSVATKRSVGSGTATIEFHWNTNTHIGKDNITIVGPGSVDETGDDTFCLTIPDNGAAITTVKVRVENSNWTPYGYGDNGNDGTGYIHDIVWTNGTISGNSYTATGGTKTITLNAGMNWLTTFSYEGNGKLDEASYTLPATYNSQPCVYMIVEESIPEGYTVSYSGSNAEGLGSGSTGMLTAYNRKISTDVKLIKVDKENHQIRLADATFEVRRLDPNQTGTAYLADMDPIQTVTTTSPNGEATISDLSIGYYEIKETDAPTGYVTVTGKDRFYIKVTSQGIFAIEPETNRNPSRWATRVNDSTLVNNRDGSFTLGNEPKKGSLKITKIVTVGDEAPNAGNAYLTDGTYTFSINGVSGTFTAGVEHTLAITFKDGQATKYSIDGLADRTDMTGSGNSWSVIIPDLKIGDYTITETSSGKLTLVRIAGGKKNVDLTDQDHDFSDTIIATVTEDDTDAAQDTAQVTFTNNTDRQIVKLRKYADEVGTNRTNLAGAEFQIYTLEEYTTGNPPQPLTYESPELSSAAASYFKADKTTMVSQNDGNFYVGDIACGNYVIVETKAPDGYLARTAVLMQVTKDQNDNKNLKYRDIIENDTYQTDTWDDRKDADSNGYYNLFIENTRIPITVTVEKVDANNSSVKLNGSTFKLYSSTTFTDDNLVKTFINTNTPTFTIATDDHEIADLLDPVAKGDTLTLYLVETVAPAGYNLPSTYYTIVITKGTAGYTMTIDGNPTTLTINNDSTRYDASLSVPNTPGVELPATGGNGTLWYNIMGLVLILLAGGLLMVNRRRAARDRG